MTREKGIASASSQSFDKLREHLERYSDEPSQLKQMRREEVEKLRELYTQAVRSGNDLVTFKLHNYICLRMLAINGCTDLIVDFLGRIRNIISGNTLNPHYSYHEAMRNYLSLITVALDGLPTQEDRDKLLSEDEYYFFRCAVKCGHIRRYGMHYNEILPLFFAYSSSELLKKAYTAIESDTNIANAVEAHYNRGQMITMAENIKTLSKLGFKAPYYNTLLFVRSVFWDHKQYLDIISEETKADLLSYIEKGDLLVSNEVIRLLNTLHLGIRAPSIVITILGYVDVSSHDRLVLSESAIAKDHDQGMLLSFWSENAYIDDSKIYQRQSKKHTEIKIPQGELMPKSNARMHQDDHKIYDNGLRSIPPGLKTKPYNGTKSIPAIARITGNASHHASGTDTNSQIKQCKERGAMPINIGEKRVDDAKNGNWYDSARSSHSSTNGSGSQKHLEYSSSNLQRPKGAPVDAAIISMSDLKNHSQSRIHDTHEKKAVAALCCSSL